MNQEIEIECDALKSINRKIKKLIIPEGVKNISYSACQFADLEEVLFPESLENIGSSAFESCHNLKRIVLPPNLKYIGSSAFAHCINLEEVILPDGIEMICSYAFFNSKIKKIYLPKSLKVIGVDALFSDEKIKIYCEDEPQKGWINEIKEEKIIESYPDSGAEGFNFHRSSGGFQMIDVVVGVNKIECLWSGKNAEVQVHVTKEDYEKEKEK